MLAGKSDTTCANKWIVYKITLFTMTLIRHEKGQLVVGARWSEVWSLLQVVSSEKSVVIVVFARFLTFSLSCNNNSTINATIDRVLNYFVDYLRIVQINVFVNKWKLFEHFDDVKLFGH